LFVVVLAAKKAYSNGRSAHTRSQSRGAAAGNARAAGLAALVAGDAASSAGESAGVFERQYKRNVLEVLADLASSSRRAVSILRVSLPDSANFYRMTRPLWTLCTLKMFLMKMMMMLPAWMALK
jgi:hypothetical protein